jgi:microcompartment protein CcmL/EutN
MVKASQVELLEAKPICPGKYIILVAGDVAAVQSSIDAGKAIGADAVVDDFVLSNVHPFVIEAISSASPVTDIAALGIIETFSVASLIAAADIAVKAAQVTLIEIRTGMGIGGKSFVTLTGDVSSVHAAVDAGAAHAAERGMVVDRVVIASPHVQLKRCIF